MAGQIIANATQLLSFDDSVKQTIVELDAILAESEEYILHAKRRISNALDHWKKQQQQAYSDLLSAEAALTQAQAASNDSNDSSIPDYLYQAVSRCQAKYDEVCSICSSIGIIYDEYLRTVSTHNNKLSELRQNYISTLQKSSLILTQYAELVRRSSAIITGIPSSSTISNQHTTDTSMTNSVTDSGACELSHTLQTWAFASDGTTVFNTPVETGAKLDSCQGKNPAFQGTCGLVSCVNVLRLSGYPATEDEVVKYASSTSAGFARGKLCITNSFPEDNGGTSASDRQKILAHFGIKSELADANVDSISKAVSEGRGVIISVYAGMLYHGWSNHRDLHAITVTSVKKDTFGNICGFFVCDSGTGGCDSAKYYTVQQIASALSGRSMNVTSIIR